MKSHLQSYPCPLQINSFWNLGNNRMKENKILIQHILVFSFLLEKSIMDGVYVIFILVEHHLSFFDLLVFGSYRQGSTVTLSVTSVAMWL